jgi:hypothetical protein
LRAGLGIDLGALAAGPTQDRGAFLGRDVEDHHRLVEILREPHHPLERFRFRQPRMAGGMVFRRRLALLQQLPAREGDEPVILGVDADERAHRLGRRHQVEQGLVREPQAVVGHERLEREVALLRQRRDVPAQGLLGRVGHDKVEGVVDHRAARGQRGVVLDDLRQIHPDMLGREGDDAGGAAERRRAGRALPGVGVHQPGGRELLDMGVAVDSARQDELAPRVDLPPSRGEVEADRRDPAVQDAEIGGEDVARGGDGAAADHGVEGGLTHTNAPRPKLARLKV